MGTAENRAFDPEYPDAAEALREFSAEAPTQEIPFESCDAVMERDLGGCFAARRALQ